jgi:hypothetical protein
MNVLWLWLLCSVFFCEGGKRFIQRISCFVERSWLKRWHLQHVDLLSTRTRHSFQTLWGAVIFLSGFEPFFVERSTVHSPKQIKFLQFF